jgi:hypothetical protein
VLSTPFQLCDAGVSTCTSYLNPLSLSNSHLLHQLLQVDAQTLAKQANAGNTNPLTPAVQKAVSDAATKAGAAVALAGGSKEDANAAGQKAAQAAVQAAMGAQGKVSFVSATEDLV